MKNSIDLEKVSLGELSEFKGKSVELYRSSCPKNTAIYWTNMNSEIERKNAHAYFELLRFAYLESEHQIYIRFPGSEHFIEMSGGGTGSGRGNMTSSSGTNPWANLYFQHKFEIISQEPQLLLLIGNSIPEFNFMELVARFTKTGNEFLFRDSSNAPSFNETEIDEVFKRKYVKLPMHVRNIEYVYKTKEVEPTYFFIDYPTYNFQYELHSLKTIKNNQVEEMSLKDFQRYRDGGTTYIKAIDKDGNEHTLYSPTSFEKEKNATWDETIELEEASESEKEYLTKLLKIELPPKKNIKMELEEINNEFVPHAESLLLKEIGFNAPCLIVYSNEGQRSPFSNFFVCNSNVPSFATGPTYRQAFKWFRDTHGLYHEIQLDQTSAPKYCFNITKFIGNPKKLSEMEWDWQDVPDANWGLYREYEQAELACLRKLIETTKTFI